MANIDQDFLIRRINEQKAYIKELEGKTYRTEVMISAKAVLDRLEAQKKKYERIQSKLRDSDRDEPEKV